MNLQSIGRVLKRGFLVRGNKIWFSELLAILIVVSVLAILFACTFTIIIDEAVIRSHEKQIANLKSDTLNLTKEITGLTQKVILYNALKAFPVDSLSYSTLSQIADLAYENSKMFGYDPFLLLAVIQVESVFRSKAKGKYKSGLESGALGLMQIKFETAQEIAKSLQLSIATPHDLFKPEINLAIGIAYLTSLIARFKSFKLGILAYNQGPGVIREHLSTQTPLSIGYYNKVLKSYYLLKEKARDQYITQVME